MNDLEKLFEHAPEGAVKKVKVEAWMNESGELNYGNGWWIPANTDAWKTIANRPQPEPKPKPKFKVGDTVKRINGAHLGMRVGDCATVSYFDGDDEVRLKEYSGAYSAEMFELAKQPETRKTVEDAVAAFPDGWPSDEYSCLFTTAPNWNGTPERIGDYELAGYTADKKDGVSLWLDGDEGWVLVCTREQFEAYGREQEAKQEGEKWTHTYAGDKCYLLEPDKDADGYYAVKTDCGLFDFARENELTPIKPTISKAEAEAVMQFAAEHGLISEAQIWTSMERNITN